MLDKILSRKMTRRQFLSYTGVAALSLFGVVRVIAELKSHASGTPIGFEPESGTVGVGATRISNSAASGGQAIKFGNGSTDEPGAAALGSTRYAIPSGALFVDGRNGNDTNPGTQAAPLKTLVTAISKTTVGTIIMRAGTYHETTNPSASKTLTIQAYPGETVWFDGSSVYPNWTQSGSTWVAAYTLKMARNIDTAKFPLTTDPYASYPDQVFIDGVRLSQIADGSSPGAGQFSVDQSAGTITIGTSPSGHEVRVSDLSQLFVASGQINLFGLGIRRYAPQTVEGLSAMIYYGGTSNGSTIENVIFDSSAMAGLTVSKSNFTIRHVTITNNNYSGLMGTACDNLLLQKCLITNNNIGLWKGAPATGGVKITRADSFTIDGNYVSGMPGANGLWLDVSCTRFAFINNTVVGGTTMATGILIEESDGGFYNGFQNKSIIASNDLSGCKVNLNISASGNIKVFNNYIHDDTQWGIILHQDRGQNNGSSSNNRTNQECPWWTVANEICNNEFGPNNIQFVSYDDVPKQLTGTDMASLFSGNWFSVAPPGSMVQWGNLGGGRTSYNSPAALAARSDLVSKGWTNYQGSTAPADSGAVALPADVAAVLGVAAGTKHIGRFS